MGKDESEYGREIDWCQINNLSLNVNKTKKLFVDFRNGKQREHSLICIFTYQNGSREMPGCMHL